jgi:hypothetical protein
LKKNLKSQTPGIVVKVREPDQKPSEEDKEDPDMAIKACALDLINAIHAKDVSKTSQVLKDVFELLESMPHEEGPHIEEGSEEV